MTDAAVAALSEGLCPACLVPLEQPDPDGWAPCEQCGCAWKLRLEILAITP